MMPTLEAIETELRNVRHDYFDLVEHLRMMADGFASGVMSAETCMREIARLSEEGRTTIGPVQTGTGFAK